jgi:hypothetical protein
MIKLWLDWKISLWVFVNWHHFNDITFELLSHNGDGNVTTVMHSIVYVLDGYLDWLCTVPPMTMTNQVNEFPHKTT